MFVSPQTDRQPHEPLRVRAATVPFLFLLLLKGVLTAGLVATTLAFWPAFALGWAIWGWPPNRSRPAEFVRYLGWAVREPAPAPGIPPLSRAWVVLSLVNRWAMVPVLGLAWYLDELLYGRALSGQPLEAPLFLLSAARSGSTQISHYLEEDDRLAAPMMMQVICPYLWVWTVVGATLGRVVPRSWPRALLEKASPEEFRQRHEGDPYRTDTFEVLYGVQRLTMLSLLLGPRLARREFAFARCEESLDDRWTSDFVDFIDRLGRKTLLYAGPDARGQPRRFFIKGHFQRLDDALADRFPGAQFVTVVRDPVKRLKSMLNHMHGSGAEPALGATPWAWLAACYPEAEAAYNRREQEWFSRSGGPLRLVVRFGDYVNDLGGTMRRIFGACFGDEALPAHVPTEHAPRERSNYRVDRGLAELGIDAEAYRESLSEYCDWARAAERHPAPGGPGESAS